MPRRKAAVKREILPDPFYGSEKFSRFTNVIMRCGKRSIAERISYTALEIAFKKVKSGYKDLIAILDKALDNIRPTVEVKSRRVGGATYQVPVEVSVDRGIALAMRWLVKVAKKRNESTMINRLAAEILEALEGRGAAVKMRDDMHKMAKANQAFAHYRW